MLSRRWYREGNIRAESDTAAHNPTWTGGNSGEEGARWCAAVVAHFKSYIKRSEAATVKESERTRLNILDPSHHRLIEPNAVSQAQYVLGLTHHPAFDGQLSSSL